MRELFLYRVPQSPLIHHNPARVNDRSGKMFPSMMRINKQAEPKRFITHSQRLSAFIPTCPGWIVIVYGSTIKYLHFLATTNAPQIQLSNKNFILS